MKHKNYICPYCEDYTIVEKRGHVSKLEKKWICTRCIAVFWKQPPYKEIDIKFGGNIELKDPNDMLDDSQKKRLGGVY